MQNSMKSAVVLVQIFTLALSLTEVNAQLPFVYCQNETVYQPNTTFRNNLETVLSSLVSNASTLSGFHNASAGSPDDNSAVYGLFYCRGDVTIAQCRDCVVSVNDRIRQRCPGARAAWIWHDFCSLRYSNETIFSKLSLEPNFTLWNSQSSRHPELFDNVWNEAMLDLKNEIVNGTAGARYGRRFFGTNVRLVTPLESITSLAQCSPDLSASDCDLCLNASIAQLPKCCFGQRGGRVIKPSCSIRSEIYPFYSGPPVLVASPSPEPDVQSMDPINDSGAGGLSSRVIVAIVLPLGVAIIVAALSVWYCCLCRGEVKKLDGGKDKGKCLMEDESLQFSFDTIQAATNCFSQDNKIGEGGFGDVYQGLLPNGTQIAVKRLSKCSIQGAQEFKNEIVLITKLQHRNLVRLLGFCSDGPEMILIYELISNKSLDHYLSDPAKQKLLDWPRRLMIINGIARGLLYLHEDSPLKIIHRDLKAANVLLDVNMDPKIADFGTARIFGADESHIITKRVIGTRGYMPPEYVIRGHYSVKSDVYSFGVLVLEIITGKKNRHVFQSDQMYEILSYAWEKWMCGTPLDLLDSCLAGAYSRDEVLKCIHMALLCVQDDLSLRPSMQTILLMLNSSSVSMPRPQPPRHCQVAGATEVN